MINFPFGWPFSGKSVGRPEIRPALPVLFGAVKRREQSGISALLALDECPVHACVAFDIVEFGARCIEEDMQVFVHCSLYAILVEAFEGAGIPWRACRRGDRGDGALIIVPDDMPLAVLLGPLVAELADRLRLYNKMVADAVQIRLRMAVHRGPVFTDENGDVGRCLVHLFRMLEAPAFKRAMKASGTDLGVVTSEHIYREVIEPAGGGHGPGAYSRIEIVLKETRSSAWMSLSGGRPPAPVAAMLTA